MEDLELEEGGILVSRKCCRKPDPEQTLILNIQSSCIYATPSKFFFQNFHGLRNSIPKHITSFDEKYALRCLELIRKFAAWNIASNVDTLARDASNITECKNRSLCEMARLAVESPSFAFGMDVVVDSTGEWTFSPVTRSASMINIMKSPLLQRYGSLDDVVEDGNISLHEGSEPVNSDTLVSTNGINRKSSHKVMVLDDKYVSAHKRAVSTSSTNSSSSDQSSCSTSAMMYQGMLTCAWKNGLPHYVYTVDDRPEVYVADLSKVESLDDKVVDFVYTFHSRKRDKKGNNSCEIYLEKVGSMRVYNSVTVCSDNSDVIETRFVLSVSNNDHHGKIQTSNHTLKKKKMLAKKVVDVLRSSHSYKRKIFNKEAPRAILEDASSNPCRETQESFNEYEDCEENRYMQDIESAAIVVKDHVFGNSKVADLGGWGMKFLKKSGNNASLETSMTSKCTQYSAQRSTTVDVLIPAGFHGGPRTINSGPSSLIERWINGGQCDCGGWDIGCPLTVLNTKSSCTDLSLFDDDSQECNSTDLFIQGSKQTMPVMKMVNIHGGLFYINFQSTLSFLQSFAIAAAIIHSRSPVLQYKLHKS
ncbi:hypothetical protein F511_22281 [Dorcoceras hygrometricum]|uniref:Uncharacterized protein n=1 Tax=Dorcoceras hygrometricum TaxID=472368 RepID=A0A2Z7CVV7_9LAMI|nr:hypothetical protein F511_22281 [Dorcoceras hygrometricum]